MTRLRTALLSAPLLAAFWGCHHPSITAVSLAPHTCHPLGHMFCYQEPAGIPFYLPKPLLIVAKNFRNVEEAKTGLTDSAPIPNYFDDQAKYADLNARTNFAGLNGAQVTSGGDSKDPAAPGIPTGASATASKPTVFSPGGPPVTPTPTQLPQELVAPETFYTYHIVFVPDLSQKYGLKIKGGAGEIRAAMNLVNGWMFTGLGPYYMKDSSTAQNTLASGITANLAASGVADVVNSIAGLKGLGVGKKEGAFEAADVAPVVRQLEQLVPHPVCLKNYAEIHVYEPTLMPDGSMDWREIVNHEFDREIIGLVNRGVVVGSPETTVAAGQIPATDTAKKSSEAAITPPAPPEPPRTQIGPFQMSMPALPGATVPPPVEAPADRRTPATATPGEEPGRPAEGAPGEPEESRPSGRGSGEALPGVDRPLSRRSSGDRGLIRAEMNQDATGQIPQIPDLAPLPPGLPAAAAPDGFASRVDALARQLQANPGRRILVPNPAAGAQESALTEAAPAAAPAVATPANQVVNQIFNGTPAAPAVAHPHKSRGWLGLHRRRQARPKVVTEVVERPAGAVPPGFIPTPGPIGAAAVSAATTAAARGGGLGRTSATPVPAETGTPPVGPIETSR